MNASKLSTAVIILAMSGAAIAADAPVAAPTATASVPAAQAAVVAPELAAQAATATKAARARAEKRAQAIEAAWVAQRRRRPGRRTPPSPPFLKASYDRHPRCEARRCAQRGRRRWR